MFSWPPSSTLRGLALSPLYLFIVSAQPDLKILTYISQTAATVFMPETNKTILLSQPPDGKAYHQSHRMESHSCSKHYSIHDKAKISVQHRSKFGKQKRKWPEAAAEQRVSEEQDLRLSLVKASNSSSKQQKSQSQQKKVKKKKKRTLSHMNKREKTPLNILVLSIAKALLDLKGPILDSIYC